MVPNRLELLQEFVRNNPDDAFGRYGLAMELMRSGASLEALEQFQVLHQQHPDYPSGFQQAGQLLIALDRRTEARTTLERGVAAAQRKGNIHAAKEMQGLLDELGNS